MVHHVVAQVTATGGMHSSFATLRISAAACFVRTGDGLRRSGKQRKRIGPSRGREMVRPVLAQDDRVRELPHPAKSLNSGSTFEMHGSFVRTRDGSPRPHSG